MLTRSSLRASWVIPLFAACLSASCGKADANCGSDCAALAGHSGSAAQRDAGGAGRDEAGAADTGGSGDSAGVGASSAGKGGGFSGDGGLPPNGGGGNGGMTCQAKHFPLSAGCSPVGSCVDYHSPLTCCPPGGCDTGCEEYACSCGTTGWACTCLPSVSPTCLDSAPTAGGGGR